MGFTAFNRQMATSIAVNRQKRKPSNEEANTDRSNVSDVFNRELNDWCCRRSIRPAVMKVM